MENTLKAKDEFLYSVWGESSDINTWKEENI